MKESSEFLHLKPEIFVIYWEPKLFGSVMIEQHLQSVVQLNTKSVHSSILYITSVTFSLKKTYLKFQIGAKGSNPQLGDDCKVGADLEKEPGNDNIPLRIILLMMDEVFDLQERNQWLRRQIVAVLRTLIKAMFGDIANRKIVDYFAQMTSQEKIGSYIDSLKQSLWPDG